MKEIYYLSSFDEFNYLCSINFFTPNNQKNIVVCHDIYEILYPNFDEIISINTSKDNPLTISQSHSEKEMFKKNVEEYIRQNTKEQIVMQSDIIPHDEHVYKFTFSELTKELLKGNCFFKPKEEDYLYVKNKLSHIKQKIVTINARNLPFNRDFGKNTNLKPLIKSLLKAGFYVINCTIPQPFLSVDSENYMEVDPKELSDYSKNISYFLNSNCLVTIANAGAVTNHICTQSNTILVGAGGWVDNSFFGYNGESLYTASKKIKPTFKINDYNLIINTINSLEKPTDLLFFDKSKVVGFHE